jgi:hypothetical protein
VLDDAARITQVERSACRVACIGYVSVGSQRVRDTPISRAQAQLLYLPSYSPDLNPIEEAFSKIKRLVRKAEARTREALVEAIGLALSAVSSEDARSFFEHCGYRMSVQSLW